jgi:isopenicillin N synthase-like dioxygenase
LNESNGTDFSDWCGWHNDHGSLTGLVPAMYLDDDGKQVACPDKEAGLYIKSRSGKLVHVSLPSGSLGFQIGETSQIHTGGILQATPHAVRGCRTEDKISRESFAVFMEPEIDGDMNLPQGKTVEDVQRQTVHLPSTVRTLQSRWKSGQNFGEFSNATFAAFY